VGALSIRIHHLDHTKRGAGRDRRPSASPWVAPQCQCDVPVDASGQATLSCARVRQCLWAGVSRPRRRGADTEAWAMCVLFFPTVSPVRA